MTKVINKARVSDDEFFIDVMYYPHTSFSKSLYPTIARAFTTTTKQLEMPHGNYQEQPHTELELGNGHEVYGTLAPYTIKRVTFKK